VSGKSCCVVNMTSLTRDKIERRTSWLAATCV
jgi:hypothetical protein